MAYMKDSTGRRLDGFPVEGKNDGAAPFPVAVTDTAEYVSISGSYRPGWLSRATGYIYNRLDSVIRRSTNGTSYTTLVTFPRAATLVRETNDGELLVCLDVGGNGSNPADPGPQVWKSNGYNGGTGDVSNIGTSWTQVLTGSDGGCRFDHRWCHWVFENHVFLIEYGYKSGDSQPKKAYHSDDHGATWRVLFTHPSPVLAEAHCHAIAYDRWWDRVWISVGDGANRAVYYADDWREASPTWVTVKTGAPNVVGIYPMRDCILFGSDDPPNGIFKYRRDGYRQIGTWETAHRINATGTLTHVAGTMWRASEDSPLLIAFAPSTTPAPPSVLVATLDGEDFYDIWVDPQGNYAAGYAKGLFSAFGPLPSGKIIGDLRDDRNAYSLFRADMPTWRKAPTVYDETAAPWRVRVDSAGAVSVEDEAGNLVPVGGGGGASSGTPEPADQDLIGWAFDPVAVQSQTVITSGTAYVVRIPVREATTITNIYLNVAVAGSGLTTGQSFAALYQDGTLLAATADQSAAWASTGLKTMALTTPQAVSAGYVEVLFWSVGTTPPSIVRGTGTQPLANVGATVKRFATADTGLTTTPPATIGTRTASPAFWAAVS